MNVAERLERLSKTLGASLVASADLVLGTLSQNGLDGWIWQEAAALEGRESELKIGFLV